MPTPKELALRALRRTTDNFHGVMEEFPLDRWRESPGGEANDLFGILTHLIECERWWRMNIGVPEDERPAMPTAEERESAEQVVEVFRRAREGLIQLLSDRPDEFFEQPVPECHYGNLHSGAELFLYAAEHDFWHLGQIKMLEMALAPSG
jgi:uncharacterized damage-inducible protein DinB